MLGASAESRSAASVYFQCTSVSQPASNSAPRGFPPTVERPVGGLLRGPNYLTKLVCNGILSIRVLRSGSKLEAVLIATKCAVIGPLRLLAALCVEIALGFKQY